MLEKIPSIIGSIVFLLIALFLIYRAFKPKMKKYEIEKNDLKDIRQQWFEYGHEDEPSIEFVYEFSREYEKGRMQAKITFFILGLFNLLISIIGLLYEIL